MLNVEFVCLVFGFVCVWFCEFMFGLVIHVIWLLFCCYFGVGLLLVGWVVWLVVSSCNSFVLGMLVAGLVVYGNCCFVVLRDWIVKCFIVSSFVRRVFCLIWALWLMLVGVCAVILCWVFLVGLLSVCLFLLYVVYLVCFPLLFYGCYCLVFRVVGLLDCDYWLYLILLIECWECGFELLFGCYIGGFD